MPDGSIEVAPGERLVPPSSGKVGTLARSDCPNYYLCVWKEANYSGWMAGYYYCGFYNLDYRYWPGHQWWDTMTNTISSLVNNQTTGTVSVFWDNSYDNGPWFSETAYGYRDNLVIDGWNDRISYILVC